MNSKVAFLATQAMSIRLLPQSNQFLLGTMPTKKLAANDVHHKDQPSRGTREMNLAASAILVIRMLAASHSILLPVR